MKIKLELGTHKQLSVAAELDHDNELELQVDYESHWLFLTVEDMKALRDHLDRLLGDTK